MPTTGTIANPRIWATGSIASGADISGDIDLMGYRPSAFDFSSGWNASNKTTFRVSQDATNWFPLFDSSGAEYAFASGVIGSATTICVVPHAEMALALQSHRWLRVQSGPSATPVAQDTGISFTIELTPV